MVCTEPTFPTHSFPPLAIRSIYCLAITRAVAFIKHRGGTKLAKSCPSIVAASVQNGRTMYPSLYWHHYGVYYLKKARSRSEGQKLVNIDTLKRLASSKGDYAFLERNPRSFCGCLQNDGALYTAIDFYLSANNGRGLIN